MSTTTTTTTVVTSNLNKPSLLAAASASPTSKKMKTLPLGSAGQTYGCSHIQTLLQQNAATAHALYGNILKLVGKWRRFTARCTKCNNSFPSVQYCLQCADISCAKDGPAHKSNGKAITHVFAVNSRTGHLYCYLCQDYIYDHTFEQIRLTFDTIASQTQTGSKKRKFDELKPSPEDSKLVDRETTTPTCRATGLRGFHNMGATCFISVVIQSLIHNPIIRNHFLADGHKEKECKRETCMGCAVNEVFSDFFRDDSTQPYSATNLLMTSWNSGRALAGKEQRDAGEYLLFLLQKLCESDGNGTEGECNCIIHQCFYGIFQTDRQCRKCRDETPPRIDSDLGIQLPLRAPKDATKKNMETQPSHKELTLETCLDAYTAKETLKLYCQSCDKNDQEFGSQSTFKRLPNVLCITLKRFFQVQGSDNKYKKNDTQVKFPVTLDMTPYTTQAKRKAGNDNRANEAFIYDLLTVVVHIGNMDTGHYISYSKGQDGLWYKFDDSTVSRAPEKQVLAANPYILFYMVRTLTS